MAPGAEPRREALQSSSVNDQVPMVVAMSSVDFVFANKIALRTSHGHFVDDEHRSCWGAPRGAAKSGQTRRARCQVANYEARRWPTERDPSNALQASVVPSPQPVFDPKISNPREFALVIGDHRVTQCQGVSSYEQVIRAD